MAAQDLATLANVREFLQTPTDDTGNDPAISSLITRASDLIMRYTQREFAPTASAATRTFEYDRNQRGWLSLAPYDLRTLTTLQIETDETSPTTLDSTQYRLWPYPARDSVYQAIRLDPPDGGDWPNRQVQITGDWGFASIPTDVVHTCVVTVAVWLRRDVAAFSTTFTLDEDRLERPEVLPQAVRAGLDYYKRMDFA